MDIAEIVFSEREQAQTDWIWSIRKLSEKAAFLNKMVLGSYRVSFERTKWEKRPGEINGCDRIRTNVRMMWSSMQKGTTRSISLTKIGIMSFRNVKRKMSWPIYRETVSCFSLNWFSYTIRKRRSCDGNETDYLWAAYKKRHVTGRTGR